MKGTVSRHDESTASSWRQRQERPRRPVSAGHVSCVAGLDRTDMHHALPKIPGPMDASPGRIGQPLDSGVRCGAASGRYGHRLPVGRRHGCRHPIHLQDTRL